MNTFDINSWDLAKLKTKLADFSGEDDLIELKSDLELSTSKEKNRNIRKHFSAFANCQGGHILVGISNSAEIVGISDDLEFATQLSSVLLNNLFPNVKWSLVNQIKIGLNKSVYIIKIEASIDHHTPCIADGKIYVRENGQSSPILHGYELKSRFLHMPFDPFCMDVLEPLIKRLAYELDYTFYEHEFILKVKFYLQNSSKIELTNLSIDFNNILSVSHMIREAEKSVTNVIEGDLKLLSDKQELDMMVDAFIDAYKRVHGISS